MYLIVSEYDLNNLLNKPVYLFVSQYTPLDITECKHYLKDAYSYACVILNGTCYEY